MVSVLERANLVREKLKMERFFSAPMLLTRIFRQLNLLQGQGLIIFGSIQSIHRRIKKIFTTR